MKQYNMYVHNYSNYINYTKQGSACEDRYYQYSPAESETQTETSCISNCLTECYYRLYTFSFTTSQT